MINTNAFTKEYFKRELGQAMSWYGSTAYGKGNAQIKPIKIPFGRVDGYMYRTYSTQSIDSIALFIDNEIWMSITPMEVESHYIPIQLAEGKVGVGGLGLGYYVNRILENALVDEVIVYELNQNVIDLYTDKFGIHEKLTIRKQDVKSIEDEDFYIFYMDIYETLYDDNAFADMASFLEKNTTEHYHFWGMEAYIASLISIGEPIHLSYANSLYYSFISEWLKDNRAVELYSNGYQIAELIDSLGLIQRFYDLEVVEV